MSKRVLVALLCLCSFLAACGQEVESGPTIDPEGPRAAFDAYRTAMRSGDLESLKGVLAAKAREGISKADPEMAIRMIQSLTPKEETVVGMMVDGDTARIRLTAMDDGKQASGKVHLVREGGKWKVQKESWDLGGGGGGSEPEPEAEKIPDREPDGDWRLDCHELAITDDPAAGRIGGKPFTVRYAHIQNGILTLTDGDRFSWDGQFMVFLFLREEDKALAGRTISIGPEKDWDAKVGAHVHYGYRTGDGNTEMEAKTDGFSLRIEFGAVKDAKLPGKIHLSYPDEKKSYVVGRLIALME